MKPITFENIRRLMGGGRKKKEKESSFKRSDSFKRISIRKNYLDRGGKKKHHQKQLEALCDDPHEITAIVKPIVSIVQEVPEEDLPTTSSKNNGSSSNIHSVVEPQPKIVPYGQWLKGVKVAENKPKVSTVKGAERTVIYIPAADEEEHLTSLSVPQQPASVVTVTTNGSDKQHFNSDKNNLSRKVSNDSAVELFPWGDSIEVMKLNKSPTFRRRNRPTTSSSSVLFSEASGGNDEMCSLSVSLGRIWMDAPMVMSPRSLELPRSSSQSNETTIHHSLDSGLKERRDDPLINRLQTHYPKKSSTNSSSGAVSRTLSSSTQNSETKTTSSNMFSSKDSGFSFSISIPKLTDSSSSNVPSSSSRGGFFRSKRPKPKLSVSRDGYFKRTSMVIESKTDFNKRTSNRSKKGNRNSGRSFKKKVIPPRTDLYQVIVNRPPRCLKNLKLDPMIFVPPEKRKTSIRKKQSFKLTVREIREYRKEEETESQPNYETLNSSLYESIAEDFYDNVPSETMSGRKSRIDNISLSKDEEIYNFSSERSEIIETKSNVENSTKEKVFDEDDSNITSDFYSNGKKCSLREFFVADIQPPSTSSKTQQTDSVSDCDESRSSDNVSTSSSNYEPEEDDDSDVLLDYSDIECVPLGVSPVPKKRPVRRRKSALSQKRAVSYVARPGIYRTPSTLRYSKSKKNKGDITQKGYEKKRTRLLSPYVPKQAQTVVSTATRAHAHSAQQRRGNRRLTRNESRYHSEVRQEAVQQALAAMQNRPKPSLPMPSKRTSVMAKSPDRERHDSASSSDDDSLVECGGVGSQQLPPPPPPPLSDTSSAGSPPPHHKQHSRSKHEITDITDVMHNLRPYTQPPDVTHNTAQNRRPAAADRVNRYGTSASDDTISMGTGRWKVSAKIQQLLNTLKRPKRRPLPEFYEDDDIELEIAANPKDPNAPKPEGSAMTAAVGEPLVVPTGLPRNLEAAIQRYGSATFKAPVATVSDPNGKLTVTLTYGKLLSRSHKIAYTLLNKCFSKGGESSLKSGDRIALVYPNNDPINFLCALYGCFQAGIVPVPIEVPLTRRDAGSQQIGFLLGSCGIQVALTSEACLKGLPKTTAGDVVTFKGWPKLHWLVTEHLPKPPKDWLPPPRLTDDTPAYIEYSTDREGSVMGVTVTRAAMLNHCRMLTMACGYTEGENMVCVLDFKREVGLWHGVLTSVLNGMHVIYIPYAVMKVNPASWMQMITKYRASVAIVKSRDLHWGLLATKDHKDINLASLRMLLIADGANPWSLSSCDQFLSVFQTKGLRPDAVCPCACSSEVLTVSLRRPGRAGAATGRGVLSMAGLSHGVVRVDQENSLTSLTLQDCGQVMPGCEIVVIKMDNTPYLCKTDEVGEICVSSGATGSQYWGLPGLSNSTFRVQPLTPTEGTPDSTTARNEKPTGVAAATGEFTRSGLLGFLGPGGLVFVCGSRDGLMTVTGRKHNADDIIATVLAVEPMKFIYRGRIAVFSIRVLRDERICVIAEQRPDCSEEESFQWMSRVLQAVDSIHQVGVYCLALVPANHLPKTPLGGIHLSESRRRFLEGTLHPANVLMCPHTCVTNLPKPREVHSDVGPASVIVGNLVQGNRLASAQGRELGPPEEESSDAARKYLFLSEILRWRAHSTPDHVLFTLLNAKGGVSRAMSCAELHKRAERVASLLSERGRVNTGAHVALVYPPGLDLVCAFYGCLYVGAVPVTIRPPHPQNLHTTLPTVRMIVDVSKAALVLSSTPVIKLLRSKEAGGVIDIKSWPPILDTDDATKRKPAVPYKAPTAEMLAYLDFSVSTTGMLAGIKMSHSAVTSLCRSMKLACELYPSRHVALCLDPYCGLGFALWVLSSVYSGHHSILIPPSEVEVNPALWLTAVSQHRVRDTFCSYGVMELCTKGLGSSVGQLKARGLSLACVRTCVVVAEERPRIALTTSFSKLFSALGLSPRAVSTSFGCRVNVAICLQGAASPEPSSVYVDLRALRNDRVTLVERGSPHSLCLLESGKLLPGVKVIIANPESRGQCGDSHLGEIWVQAPHCASGYFTIYGDESEYADHFNAKLVTGGTGEVYCRTGYLGFLRRTEGGSGGQLGGDTDLLNDDVSSLSETSSIQTIPQSIQQNETAVELHDAVFVVGALDETIMLRGMRYHPIDIENSVLRCHKKIAECAVFTWTNLLVVVVELDGNESEALDVVPLVTNTVLEEQQLVVGVVVVVDPGVVPVNSRGEKQRMHLRDGFLADQLDPIYVAYNM